VALEHAAQSERYTHDARGLVLTSTVLRPGLQALTRYAYDEEGRLHSQTRKLPPEVDSP
jgi:YD repeat-containing protein